MHIIFFEELKTQQSLLPFTFTRPHSHIRCGIFTIAEKWQNAFLNSTISYLCMDKMLAKKFPTHNESLNLYINSAFLPNPAWVKHIHQLSPNSGLMYQNKLVAYLTNTRFSIEELQDLETNKCMSITDHISKITKKWHIFELNASEIKSDITYIKLHNKNIGVNDSFSKCYNPENIFVEEGAKVYASVLNATNGPIYIGKNAEVQEGTLIRGSFALCQDSVTNMGTKIRGDVTIGPGAKVGGEISNSVIFGYSNKAHDGFLGNSVIGEWCNLGADTNTSNLKNNYSPVSLYDYSTNQFENTELQFCGLMMGDHSKCSINTMFNTGTVVGVNANIFGANFPPKQIPSYAWGGSDGFEKYNFEKAIEVAKVVYQRRNKLLTDIDIEILKNIHNIT